MTNYYFIGTLLPDLHIGEPPELSFKELELLLQDNLSAGDYAKTSTIRNYYDISNLRLYWKGDPFDPVGNLDANALEEALVTRSIFPEYVFSFLDKYESKEERLRHFSELLAHFFHQGIKRARGVFKQYLIMEREIRLVLVAFRAKKMGRDVVPELQYEDPEEDLVAQILAQKDASQFEPPEKYEELKTLFIQYGDDPIGLHKMLYEYHFKKIDALLDFDLFSINRIIGYMIKLIMVENWQRLDKLKGLKIIDSMMEHK